jgi:histidine triad (HIT) family protein
MQDSIFTKIIKGDIPCYKIYEDEKVIAFLDIHPVQPGHVLVVPKVQVDHFQELPDEFYDATWQVVKKIAKHQREVLKTARVGVSIVGTDVPHAHVHLIPFNESQELHTQLDFNAEPNHQALSEMVDKLKMGDN